MSDWQQKLSHAKAVDSRTSGRHLQNCLIMMKAAEQMFKSGPVQTNVGHAPSEEYESLEDRMRLVIHGLDGLGGNAPHYIGWAKAELTRARAAIQNIEEDS